MEPVAAGRTQLSEERDVSTNVKSAARARQHQQLDPAMWTQTAVAIVHLRTRNQHQKDRNLQDHKATCMRQNNHRSGEAGLAVKPTAMNQEIRSDGGTARPRASVRRDAANQLLLEREVACRRRAESNAKKKSNRNEDRSAWGARSFQARSGGPFGSWRSVYSSS
jgi:hypothetical protein